MGQENTSSNEVIWIDPEINYGEKNAYAKKLSSLCNKKIKLCETVKESIKYIKKKECRFIEIKIIVSGKLYVKFIQSFRKNIRDIFVIPKILIFTDSKELFLKRNKSHEDLINHSFYNFGGIKTSFEEFKEFIIDKGIVTNKNEDNILMTFEYIDNRAKLLLPLFYKTLTDTISSDKLENYTNLLYAKYSKQSDKIKNLLGQITALKDVPIELLSKYYIRVFTIDSNFYRDINKDLLMNE